MSDTDKLELEMPPTSPASSAGPVAGAGGAAGGGSDKAAANAEVDKEHPLMSMWKMREELPPVSYFSLFRYASHMDHFIMFVGLVGSAINGLTLVAFSYLFGDLLDTLNSEDGFLEEVEDIAVLFVIVGLVSFVVSLGEMSLMNISATRQIRIVRQKYFHSILRQDVSWFDVNSGASIASRLAENTIQMHSGLGHKLGNTVHNITTAIGGVALGFAFSWKLTLVLLAFTPLLGFAGSLLKVLGDKYETLLKDSYASAGAVASQALSSLQTVTAFGGHKVEVDHYATHLTAAEKAGNLKGRATGFSMGIMYFVIFATYGVGLWYGSTLVVDSNKDDPKCIDDPTTGDCFTGGDVLLVFFAVIMGSFSLGQIGPNMGAFTSARAAAARIFYIIDRKPVIDVASEEGTTIPRENVRGAISFRDVTFTYPTRPGRPVLSNFSLDIQPGETVAFVGESGSGKSTLVQLIQRFYDPDSGSVTLDGVPLTQANVRSLRATMGLVSQEPTLFALSIRDNIALGAEGDQAPSDEDIRNAAALANASDFIERLPEQYDTPVGERGAQLSGGQKQRVAIARAVIRNPPILLLDEATSALDTRSERVVQAALDNLVTSGTRRTTIIIAHRLSTISNVDRIVVLHQGTIVEMGSHQDLVDRPGGYYRRMLEMQRLSDSSADGGDEGKAGEDDLPDPDEVTLAPKPAQDDPKDSADATSGRTRSRTRSADGKTDPSASAGAGGKPGGDVDAAGTPVDENDAEAAVEGGKAAGKGAKSQKKKNKYADVPFKRVISYQKSEYHLLALGTLFAVINGTVMPLFAVIFTEILDVLFQEDQDKLEDDALILMVYFLALAVMSGIAYLLQPWLFTMAGESLTKRLRRDAFDAILRQEMGFFDDPQNSVGALTTRLSTDAALIHYTTGQRLGLTIQNTVALLAAVIIAFVSSWRLTLVVFATMPLMMAGGMVMMKFMTDNEKDKTFTEAGSIAAEAVSGIRTVNAFTLHSRIEERFAASLVEGTSHADRAHWIGGAVFGSTQFALFGTYALCFWAGGKFIEEDYIDFSDMIRVFFALSMASWGIGENSQQAADQHAADEAKKSVFALIDRKSAIDPSDESGLSPAGCRGEIEFRNVTFSYPTRSNQTALDNLSFVIKPGQTVAFVGASGCGKSTIIRLLERFYDPQAGEILLDGQPLRSLNIQWLRAQMGLVSQEPVLFDDTISYNIMYGDPTSRPVPKSQVQESIDRPLSSTEAPNSVVTAAMSANASGFIDGFPLKYNTRAGEAGSQLSGGQKQRVAIARALVRTPTMFLFDEATSALDSESEAVVQAAIDKIMDERHGSATMIIIAHRLATIRKADVIVVLEQGRLAEMGSHEELLRNPDGKYFKLIEAQQVSTDTSESANESKSSP